MSLMFLEHRIDGRDDERKDYGRRLRLYWEKDVNALSREIGLCYLQNKLKPDIISK